MDRRTSQEIIPSSSVIATALKYRKLRIAWSVVWGIAALMLVALWLRSFHWDDNYEVLIRNTWWGGGTHRGSMALNWIDASKRQPAKVGYACIPASDALLGGNLPDPFWGFYCATFDAGFGLLLPIWLLAFVVASIAVAPWLKWHFRLRTVLIGLTLVAILLGWNVWMVRFAKPL